MDTRDSKVIKICSKERILRILRKVCGGQLSVLLYEPSRKSIMIKARAGGLELEQRGYELEPKSLFLTSLSSSALEKIVSFDQVTVEFMLMNSRIFFLGSLGHIGSESIHVKLPDELVNEERRKEVRAISSTGLMSCKGTKFEMDS